METLFARSSLVMASRVSGIRATIDGVHVALDGDAALQQSTAAGRALGFFGRSAVRPRQVSIINAVFTPNDAELVHAREIIEAAKSATVAGQGALRLTNGELIDAAMARRAEDVLRLADVLTARQV